VNAFVTVGITCFRSDEDDGAFGYAKPSYVKVRLTPLHLCIQHLRCITEQQHLSRFSRCCTQGGDSDDTESDTVSEFSEDSRAYASAPASTKPSFLAPPLANKAPAPAPPPANRSSAAPSVAAPPPPEVRTRCSCHYSLRSLVRYLFVTCLLVVLSLQRRGTGLLDSSNKAVANMLSQSQARAQQKANDGSDDDDWD
jgi:hypothetical protein